MLTLQMIQQYNCIEVINMATLTTNLNIRLNKDVKDQSEAIFSELGMNMTTAINLFLRTSIREHGIPFPLKLDVPNAETAAAIEEGWRIAHDPNAETYHSIEELRKALDA